MIDPQVFLSRNMISPEDFLKKNVRQPEEPKKPSGSFLGDIGRSVATGAGSAMGGITSAAGYIGKKLGQFNPINEDVNKKLFPNGEKMIDPGEWLSNAALSAGSSAQKMAQGWSKDVPQNLVNQTASGVGSMIPYFAAGAATGGLAGVPLVGGLLRSETETQSNAAQTYQALREQGADDKTAMRAAVRQEWPDRVINAALEPFGALSNKGRLVRTLAEAVQEGVLQEPAQQITQNAAMRSAKGGLMDYAGALFDEAKNYQVNVPAMIAGGLVGGLTPGLGRKEKTPASVNNPATLQSVSNLNGIQQGTFEPVMPHGNEVSDVKIGDVKRLVENVLGVPVREGQIREKNLLGFISYNPYRDKPNDMIRTKGRNDIATLLHEFGHGVDHIYGLTESNTSQKQVFPEFAKFGKAMGYKPKKWLSEGLAQFYQWRGIDPQQAYQMFPEYSKIFDKFIESNPDARAKIEPVFKAAHDYYFGSPETRLDAAIGSGAIPRRSVKQWASDTWRGARRDMVDRQQVFSDVGDMVADAINNPVTMNNPVIMNKLGIDPQKVKEFGMKRMLPDSINLEAQARTMPGTQSVVKSQVDSFLSDVKGLSPEEHKALRLYMTAGGGLDYFNNGMNPGLGLSPADLNGVRARTPDKIKNIADKMKVQYDGMMENTLIRTGMLTKEKLTEWKQKYPNYVPMLHEDGEGGYSVLSPQQAKATGFVDLKDPIRARSGVKNDADLIARRDPVEAMVSNYKKFNDLAARNDVAKTLINISRIPGLMRVAEKVPGKGPNTFTIWDKGKQHYYATDPEIYSALKSLGEAGVPEGAFKKLAHSAGEVFKMGTTRYNPWFLIKNLFRDSVTSSVQSGSKITDVKNLPLVNTFDGVLKILNDKATYSKAQANGVFYSSMVELNRENIPKLIEGHLKGGPLKESMRAVRAVLEKIGSANEVIELAPKMREYAKLVEMGIPEKQAAMEAREVNSDFQRAGDFGRTANKYVPFLNAQIQGLDKAIRTFKDKPIESTMKAGLYIMLPSLIEWALYHDDEDYQALDKGIKDTHWVFRLPGAAPDDFKRVPMPFELGVLFGGATKRAMDKMFVNDPAASYQYLTSIKDAALPELQIALLRPMMEVWANKDSFRDRAIVPMREQKLPNRLQYGGSTSYVAKLAGKAGVSPRIVDHLIRGYGGSMAAQAVHGLDVFDSGKAPAPARGWSDGMLLRPYSISSLTSNHYQNRFYDVTEQLEREQNGAKSVREPYANSGLASFMKSRRSALSEIWKQIGGIKDSQRMNPDAKKKAIDSLTARANKIAKQALTVYDRRMK